MEDIRVSPNVVRGDSLLGMDSKTALDANGLS
jgi:hypothetical protein